MNRHFESRICVILSHNSNVMVIVVTFGLVFDIVLVIVIGTVIVVVLAIVAGVSLVRCSVLALFILVNYLLG